MRHPVSVCSCFFSFFVRILYSFFEGQLVITINRRRTYLHRKVVSAFRLGRWQDGRVVKMNRGNDRLTWKRSPSYAISCREFRQLPPSVAAPSSSSFPSINGVNGGRPPTQRITEDYVKQQNPKHIADSAICVICFRSIREQKRTEARSKVSAPPRTYNQIHYFIFRTRMDANLTRQQKPSSRQRGKLIALVISHQRRFHGYSW